MYSIVALLTIGCLFIGPSASWEDKWQRTKLTDAQVATAKTVLTDMKLSKWCKDFHTRALKGILLEEKDGKMVETKEDTSNHAKYSVLDLSKGKDAERYKPLCKVIFEMVEADPKTKKYDGEPEITTLCSCSFIGHELVLLAAHCFDETPDALKVYNVMYVVPNYGVSGNNAEAHANHRDMFARIAVEWWVPAAWKGWDGKGPVPVQYDVAFIKTHAPLV